MLCICIAGTTRDLLCSAKKPFAMLISPLLHSRESTPQSDLRFSVRIVNGLADHMMWGDQTARHLPAQHSRPGRKPEARQRTPTPIRTPATQTAARARPSYRLSRPSSSRTSTCTGPPASRPWPGDSLPAPSPSPPLHHYNLQLLASIFTWSRARAAQRAKIQAALLWLESVIQGHLKRTWSQNAAG